MAEAKSIREQLYADVWSAPMTTVAKKYNLSDTGVRKKCKSLDIPVPSFGYWAKKKAGKEVPERPPLPPYNEKIINNEDFSAKEIGAIRLRDLDNMSIEQVSILQDLDILMPESKEYFNNLINSIIVPGRIVNYDCLIMNHKTEIEYREARDKAYPFRADHIKLWTYGNQTIERDNISVIPIRVSSSQICRAYRIADTIIKTFRKFKSNISVTNTREDNVCIKLLNSMVSFEIIESKTKRRHLEDLANLKEFRPLYEEVYDGNIQITWKINGYTQYSFFSRCKDSKNEGSYLIYSDSKDNPLENQISIMILEIYKHCCKKEIDRTIEQKIQYQNYEREKKERINEVDAQKMRKLEEEKQSQLNSLVNGILEQSSNWFKHKQLKKYADELDEVLTSCSDTETTRLLSAYIRLIRENADKLNPLDDIIDKMRVIEKSSEKE